MIFMELIFLKNKSRHFLTVDEEMTVGDFKKNLSTKLQINSTCIHLLGPGNDLSDDMKISSGSIVNGSGVVIEDG